MRNTFSQKPILCANIAASPLQCDIDSGSYIEGQVIANQPDYWQIVQYNIDRNGKGGDGPNETGITGILNALKSLGDSDVILLNEVARDCPLWENGVNGAEEIAKQLKMAYYYSVAYVITNQSNQQTGVQCTSGNAILTKYPMTVEQKRFTSQCCEFPDRVGGRVAIKGTVIALKAVFINAHLESGTGVSDFSQAEITRNKQISELISFFTPIESKSQINVIAGDFNAPLVQFIDDNIFLGFDDAHSDIKWPNRNTSINSELNKLGLGAYDYIYVKNHRPKYALTGSICSSNDCKGKSDHYPIIAKFRLNTNLIQFSLFIFLFLFLIF